MKNGLSWRNILQPLFCGPGCRVKTNRWDFTKNTEFGGDLQGLITLKTHLPAIKKESLINKVRRAARPYSSIKHFGISAKRHA